MQGNKFWSSSIGLKTLMALSGLGLLLFVIMHMIGNLQVFLGPAAINEYAVLIHKYPALLWSARIGLLAIFVLHTSSALRLRARNTAARPEKYRKKTNVQASSSSNSMYLTGSLVAMFIVAHLLHFTLGVIMPEYSNLRDSLGRHDVYSMIVLSFSNPCASTVYVLAMIALGFHLRHGIASFFQTLGLSGPAYKPLIEKVAPALAAFIVLGYIAIPLAVMAGVLSVPAGGGY